MADKKQSENPYKDIDLSDLEVAGQFQQAVNLRESSFDREVNQAMQEFTPKNKDYKSTANGVLPTKVIQATKNKPPPTTAVGMRSPRRSPMRSPDRRAI